MQHKDNFHITIGAAIRGGAEDEMDSTSDIEHTLRLTKAALLYADKVMLCSPIAVILTPLSTVTHLTEMQQVELLEMCSPFVSENEEKSQKSLEFCRLYRQLRSSRRPNVNELRMLASIKTVMGSFLEELNSIMLRLATEYKADQFEKLVQLGILEIKPLGRQLTPVQWIASTIQNAVEFNTLLEGKTVHKLALPGNSKEDSSQMMEDFLSELAKAIENPSSYPLFDGFTGNMVRLGLQEGKFDFSDAQTDRAKPIGLATDLIERLPTFDNASIDEIVDIRAELKKPLIRFRAAMIEFSHSIKSAAWDDSFPIEADNVFRSNIQPAVLEIEDAVKSNSYLRELGKMVINKPAHLPAGGAVAGLIGAGLSQLETIPALAASIVSSAAGISYLSWSAQEKWSENKRKIESNQLFFYYKSGKILERKTRA